MDKIWKIAGLVAVLLIAVSVFVSMASGASSSTEQVKTSSELQAMEKQVVDKVNKQLPNQAGAVAIYAEDLAKNGGMVMLADLSLVTVPKTLQVCL